ncbi:hypothetical protein INT45_001195 [Circinella minor]|uniref:Uncharacterized protein n=1 Tax=Circinella minor TaxID=1195481 RepID=A0A8H7RUZ5_9FUNG|nr:hypothetical protein INT45_001195 [Circinella minor]
MVILATGRHLSSVATAAAFNVRTQSSRQHNKNTTSNISSTLGKIRQQQTTSFSSTTSPRASHYQEPSKTASSAGPRYYDNPSPRSDSSSSSSSSQSNYNYYSNASSEGGASSSSSGPTITEQSILGAFPRPNLSPTLHFSIFTNHFDGKSSPLKDDSKCGNCSGPHSTDFCPC